MALAERMPTELLLEELADDGRVVHVEHLPARPARYASLERPLPPALARLVPPAGLWSHQVQAVDLLRRGQSVVVATDTASGKSLCYQLPIAEAVADRLRPATALLLFPTKALAHDQLRSLGGLQVPGMVPVAYDGDTDQATRAWAREHANVVLTNPEMLHAGLLPHHTRWATFLRRLRYVVIDELHVLRGVFGTHLAHLVRRLRRLCAHYGAHPTFAFCSATIGQPDRLASTLCGLDVVAVDEDGSPRGQRRFALLDPPVVDELSGARTSSNAETASMVARLVAADRRAIAFCRSRKGTELVAADIARRLPLELRDAVRAYRSGYLAEERRQIEAELFGGEVRAVVATSALELGVDIGALDACVLNGFPGTIASMWQQAGRAGRQCQDSLSVLVAGEDQLDRWFMANPREVFRRAPEPSVINPANPFILDPHLACAAYELALTPADRRYWGDDLDDGVRRLVVGDQLATRCRPARGGGQDEPVAVWAGKGVPGRNIGLRAAGGAEIRIVRTDGSLIGTVDQVRACASVHEGAVYLHRGQSYRVLELDLDGQEAVVELDDGDTYTQARELTDIAVLGQDRHCSVGGSELYLGAVEVRSQVVGYQRKDVRTRKILANEALELPPQELVTRAFWYTVSPELLAGAGVGPDAVPGTLHATEHAAIGLLPLFTICDRWDVGGVSTALHRDTGLPTIFVYDGYPGGAGIAELGFDHADRHLRATLELLEACQCPAGCPSCVQSPKCGNGNEPLDKQGAAALLRAILAGDPSALHPHGGAFHENHVVDQAPYQRQVGRGAVGDLDGDE
jgi:DEAD/DEAH box helicase domain-containing protein